MKTWQINEPFIYFQTTISLDFQNCKKGRKPQIWSNPLIFLWSLVKSSNIRIWFCFFYKKWVCRFSKSCKLTFSVRNNQLHPHSLVIILFTDKNSIWADKNKQHILWHMSESVDLGLGDESDEQVIKLKMWFDFK